MRNKMYIHLPLSVEPRQSMSLRRQTSAQPRGIMRTSSGHVIRVRRRRLLHHVFVRNDGADRTAISLIFNFGYPNRRPCRRCQQEKEGQDGYQFQHHGYGAKPDVVPSKKPGLSFCFILGKTAQLIPPVVCQLAQPCPRDHDESRSAHIGDEVERQEHDQLDHLNHTPGSIHCRARRLPQHADSRGCIVEEDSVRLNKVLEPESYEGGLAKYLVSSESRHLLTLITCDANDNSHRTRQRGTRPQKILQTDPG